MTRYLAFFMIVFAAAACPSTGASAEGSLPAEAFPNPGRPVAEIVSPIWHTEEDRDANKEVLEVATLLDIAPGMTVADIGAGSGYYVTRLVPFVGESGRIIAEDVTPSYLQILRMKISNLRLANVTVIEGLPHNPKLPPRSVDRALLVHMYHEVQQPFALLYHLAQALKPGAKVGIVDAMRNIPEHGTPPSLLRCEMEAMGYRQMEFHRLLESQTYLAIFELPQGRKPTPPNAIVPCQEGQSAPEFEAPN